MTTAREPYPRDPHENTPDPQPPTRQESTAGGGDGTVLDGCVTAPGGAVVDFPAARARRRPATGPARDAATTAATEPVPVADEPATPVANWAATVPLPVATEVADTVATDAASSTGTVAVPVVSGKVVATGPDARPALATRALVAARTSGHRAVVVGRMVGGVATHERTLTTVKTVLRHVLFVPAGAVCLAKRVWDARTTARFERMMRAAEVSGNAELMADWQHRAELFKAARHDRLMRWIHAPIAIARGLAVAFVTSVFGLLILGGLLASARHEWGTILVPLQTAVTAVNTTVLLLAAAWGPLVTIAPWVMVAVLWNEGRRRAPIPTWLATTADVDMDVTIDEHTIARALLALRIPQIRDALKIAPLQFITTARKDGRGTHAVIRLPAGVTAEKIVKRRADFATGLYRRATEVWPSTGTEAGILDLWVADKGALAEGAGPYPLAASGLVDVFKGVPFGKTLRGDPVLAPLIGRNTITGGMPDQGKSSAARCIVTGAALDPTAELRIWVPDANFDFEVFKPRCARYVMGAEDEKIEAIVQDLRALKAEVQTRGELLVKYQVASVTRELASRGVGLHPLVCLLEEAHVVMQHPTWGKEACSLLTEIVKLCRKRAIHVIISTQAPTANSVPRDVTRNCSNGIAFAVGDHVANDGLLGEGAHKAGHRATELIPGTDVGTALVKGMIPGQRSETVQVYYLSVNKDTDQVTPLLKRVLAVMDKKAMPIPGKGKAAPVPVRRDLLEDLAEVLGDEPVPVADVPALLSRAWPTWEPYRAMNGKVLRAKLQRDYGIRVPSTGNRWPIDPITVRDALARRLASEDDTPRDE